MLRYKGHARQYTGIWRHYPRGRLVRQERVVTGATVVMNLTGKLMISGVHAAVRRGQMILASRKMKRGCNRRSATAAMNDCDTTTKEHIIPVWALRC